jgi:hypothetical protein
MSRGAFTAVDFVRAESAGQPVSRFIRRFPDSLSLSDFLLTARFASLAAISKGGVHYAE